MWSPRVTCAAIPKDGLPVLHSDARKSRATGAARTLATGSLLRWCLFSSLPPKHRASLRSSQGEGLSPCPASALASRRAGPQLQPRRALSAAPPPPPQAVLFHIHLAEPGEQLGLKCFTCQAKLISALALGDNGRATEDRKARHLTVCFRPPVGRRSEG